MENPTLEYIIKQKNEGKVILRKAGFILGILMLFISLAVLILNLFAPALYLPFILLDLALCAMAFFIAWRFFFLEYEIILSGGDISLTVIYGKSIRRRLALIPIDSLSEVGIYDDGAYEKLCRASLQKNYVCVSTMAAPTVYYALFEEKKERCVLYFETDERGLAYLKQKNSGALRAGNIK